MDCTIKTREIDGVVLIDVAGRMSFPDPHLQPLLNGLIESGKRLFVINLSDVSYMDSYGIGDLIIAYNATKAAGGRISLLRPVPNVKKSLEITTKTTFQIFDEEAAAVKSVRAAG